jgi:aspartyl-tRNA(Asn)/glutamyl-tRNA(Gln) amidotransferase subunit C
MEIYKNPVLEDITNLLYGCYIQCSTGGNSLKITEDQVIHVAKLARLRLEPKELARFQKDISAILEYMDVLNEVNTIGVKPTFHAHSITDALRDDDPERSQSIDDALLNAPQVRGDTLAVPKIIE